jgi:hypothetical protein
MTLLLLINRQDFMFDVDTGANHTIVSLKDWEKLGSPTTRPSSLKLECYSGQPLEVQGEFDVKVENRGQKFNLTMVVIKSAGTPLLGLHWITVMQVDLNSLVHGLDANKHQVHKVYSQVKLQDMLEKHKVVFDKELGHCTKVQAHIQLVPNAIPKFFKPRPLPFAYLDGVKEEIQRNVTRALLNELIHRNGLHRSFQFVNLQANSYMWRF